MNRRKVIGRAAGLAVVFVVGLLAGGMAQASELRWVASEMMPPRWAIDMPESNSGRAVSCVAFKNSMLCAVAPFCYGTDLSLARDPHFFLIESG